MRGRPGERIPEGENEEEALLSCWHMQKLPLHQIHYKNITIETASIQENNHPSLRKGNGGIVCRTCLKPVEYAFCRERGRRYTTEEGLTAETTSVVIGRCPTDGRYSTIYPDDLVYYKQYSLRDIQCVLENKGDYSLASARTKSYWRSWFKGVWDAVVVKIQLDLGRIFSEKDISTELLAFCKKVGDEWLRYVLDLFHTGYNNLCMFVDLIGLTIGLGGEKPYQAHLQGGADASPKRGKPPPGG